ncbi:acyltransferase [Weissella viridescens]|uniref:Acyltransferase n=1 Tax=Weissella viridescens TaxID=1629 RepID=A0A3P2RAY0_WEIVI|nr:acyltransferase [Weissella viridescens]RRG17703.1 acyltransferase [Weissella viridescens]
MQKKRIHAIDIAKGMAILLVVFGHAVQGINSSEHLGFTTAWSSIYVAKAVIYSFHMPAFFILSGLFVDHWLRKPTKVALWDKIKRLAYPYFVWSIILGTIMQVVQQYTNGGLGFKELVQAPIVPFSEYWFLYLLFFFFMTYLIVGRLWPRGYKPLLLIVGAALFISYPFLPDVWILLRFSKFFIFFALGTYLLDFFTVEEKRKQTWLGLGVSTGAFVCVETLYILVLRANLTHLADYVWFFTAIMGTAMLCYAAKLIAHQANHWSVKALEYTGVISMQIYVMHIIPLAGTRIFLLRFAHVTNLWLVAIIIFIVALIFSYLGSYVIKRCHLNEWFFAEK